jgi:hypothetical protein
MGYNVPPIGGRPPPPPRAGRPRAKNDLPALVQRYVDINWDFSKVTTDGPEVWVTDSTQKVEFYRGQLPAKPGIMISFVTPPVDLFIRVRHNGRTIERIIPFDKLMIELDLLKDEV